MGKVRGFRPRGFGVAALLTASLVAGAQESLSPEELARVDTAVREAFAFLYALPSDTAGVAMGSWVVDSAATTPASPSTGPWRLVVTRLSDTGQGLKLNEMVGEHGTSPAQLAAAMAAMQRLEGRISKAEAEASLDIVVSVNEPEITVTGVSDEARQTRPAIKGAQLSRRLDGDWMHLDDRELEVDYERWSPATLLVGFGAFNPVETRRLVAKESLATFNVRANPASGRQGIRSVVVTAQGNEKMIERVVKETKWAALSGLIE
jgi:hypothetical protein